MSRIELPKPAQKKSSAPSWINKEALLQASGEEAKKNQETLDKIKSNAEVIVLSYFNPNNNAVFSADDTRLLAQMRLQQNQGSTSFKFTDPNTEEPLFAYKTAKRVKKVDNIRYSNTELKPERGGTYTNTFIDRHIAYKALEEMQRYASSKGMAIPRARYIRSSYGSKQLGSNLVTINNILTELEWHYGRNQKGRVFATISVDPAGKFIQPLTFKIASGEDFEFTEENIRMLEKDARFMEMMTLIKPKKTDIPTFRRPDISRFMATASMKKDAMPDGYAPGMNTSEGQPPITGQPVTNPAYPGSYEAGSQYTNPADGKIYTMKSYDPNTGAIVTSPEGQDMSIPANEVPNLKPLVPTAKKNAMEFSVEAMAEEMVQKHLRRDIKNDTQQAKELYGLAEEEEAEVSDDQQLINMLSTKKKAMHDYEKNPDDYKKCTYCNGDGKMKNGEKCEHCNGSGYMKKESSLTPLKTVVASKNVHFSHVPHMSKRWNEIRKGLQEKLNKEKKGDHPFDLAPETLSREQQAVQHLTSVGYKGYSPLNNDANNEGRDAKTHIPTSTSGNVEIGLTEYEDYNKPFQEVQQEMVDRREHFQNQDKLWYKDMKREEFQEYADGSYKDKGYGLSETSRDGEFENPELQFEAANDALANEMIQKKSMEEGEVQERPIVHKDMKRAPGLEGYKEPEIIGEAESKVKEGITKLRKVQTDIKEVKANLQTAIAPLQKKLQETQKPFNEELIKQQESLSSYLEMIYSQLSQTEDKIAAYEDKIFSVVELSKDVTAKVSLAKLLKKLEETDQALFEGISKVKEAMENESVTSVLERFLYEYPVSEQHRQKKIVRTSDEEGTFNNALKVLKDALMGLFNLSDVLEENLEVA